MNVKRSRRAAIVAALLMVTFGACSPEQPTDPDADPPGANGALAHAKCMRDHGFDWPDPAYVDGQWETHYEGIDLESAEFKLAETECRRAWEEADSGQGSGEGPQDRARLEEELARHLQFAACMRDQGIDFPDPVIDGDDISGPAGPSDGDWEAFEAAKRVCEETVDAPTP